MTKQKRLVRPEDGFGILGFQGYGDLNLENHCQKEEDIRFLKGKALILAPSIKEQNIQYGYILLYPQTNQMLVNYNNSYQIEY